MTTPRFTTAVAAIVGAALAVSPLAAADKEPVHLTAAGQADARAAIVDRADLGTTATWTGGTTKPQLNSSFPACTYKPKQSDLVVNGAAESDWKTQGIEFDSQAEVLKTAAMVSLDWQRTVAAPQVLPCLREGLAKATQPPAHLVSLKPIGFPQLSQYARKYRAILDVTTATHKEVPVIIDIILVGQGRTEITLTTTTAYQDRAPVSAAELRLAEALISRIRG